MRRMEVGRRMEKEGGGWRELVGGRRIERGWRELVGGRRIERGRWREEEGGGGSEEDGGREDVRKRRMEEEGERSMWGADIIRYCLYSCM